MTVSNTSPRCQNSFTRKTYPVDVVAGRKRREGIIIIIIYRQRVPPDCEGTSRVYAFCIQSERTDLGL